MFVEYTVPKGPSYFRPPLFTGRSFSVWHPQPPVAPKTYFPRATGSELGGACAQAGDAASPPTRTAQERGRAAGPATTVADTVERQS